MKEIKELKEIQTIELEILKFVDKVCRENNIIYTLTGGTAIGAIRHVGFIPWDDDIDIMMPREHYEKFLRVINNYNDSFKCLHFPNKNYFYSFAKVVDTRTVLTENNLLEIDDMGIYIDVFPMDYMNPKTAKRDAKKVGRLKTLATLAATTKFEKSKWGFAKTIVKFGVFIIAKMFGYKFWIKKIENILKKIAKNPESKSNMGVYSQIYYEKEMMPVDAAHDVIETNFEGCKFYILKSYDAYLKNIYGDYMQLPSEDKQKSHHNFKAWYKNEE